MMDFMVGDPIRLLPCMHFYHLHCIDDWLMRSITCPTCMERVDIGLTTTARSSRLRRRRRVCSSTSSTSSYTSNPSISTSSEQIQVISHPEHSESDIGTSHQQVRSPHHTLSPVSRSPPLSPLQVRTPVSPHRTTTPLSPHRVTPPLSPPVYLRNPPSPPLLVTGDAGTSQNPFHHRRNFSN